MPDGGYVFEPQDAVPPEPLTMERIAAFYTEIEASKRILACAPDVYERARQAVENGPLAAYFRVIEQPLLDDGQVLSIDPTLLDPPPLELPADWLAPKYRCLNCLDPIHEPGYCLRCEPFAKAMKRERSTRGLIAGFGGTGF